MKMRAVLIATLLLAATAALAGKTTTKGTPDSELGLTKTSVFEVPAPDAFAHPSTRPGKSTRLPRAFPGAPPQVPHRVSRYLPLLPDDNRCVDCHDVTDEWGEKVAKGDPVPMPKSHYRMDGDAPALAGSRFVCVLCHVPQAGAPDLVGNTFDGPLKTKRK